MMDDNTHHHKRDLLQNSIPASNNSLYCLLTMTISTHTETHTHTLFPFLIKVDFFPPEMYNKTKKNPLPNTSLYTELPQ